MEDERILLLQLVRDGKPGLSLIGQVHGGYEPITADDTNWETSRIKPSQKG